MSIFQNKRGAISVFLMIIFLSLLMLAGLIIDFCRVMAAERNVQNALDTATRSVLAQYDPELVGQFGLYGVAYQVKKEELARYFRVNLAERHKNFNFIKYKTNNVEIRSLAQQSLLNDQVFKEQVNQYMKYKGPLLLTENVVDIFLKGSFLKKADLLNSGGEVASSIKKISRIKNKLNQELQEVMEWSKGSALKKIVTINNMKNSISGLRQLTQITQEKTADANKQIAAIKHEISWQNVQEVENGEDLEAFKDKLVDLQADLEFNLGIWEEIASLEKEISDLEILNRQKGLLYEKLRLLELLVFMEKAPEQIPLVPEEIKIKNEIINHLQKVGGQQITSDNPVTVLIEPAYFAKANQQVLNKNADGFVALEFTDLDQITEIAEGNDLAENMGKNIVDYLQTINQQIKQAVISGKDKIYLTEYIMDKYTFVTSPVKRGHFFEQGEVEFLLFQHKNECLNLAQAFRQVWLMRFAINVVDGFFLNSCPFVTARLGQALVNGFIGATKDMLAMYGGKSVPIGISLDDSVRGLSYADHLRLLLLIQKEESLLKGMRQLIQINIRQVQADFELKNYASVLSGEVDVSFNLWFSPLLQLDKFGFKQIQGSNYNFRKTARLGY